MPWFVWAWPKPTLEPVLNKWKLQEGESDTRMIIDPNWTQSSHWIDVHTDLPWMPATFLARFPVSVKSFIVTRAKSFWPRPKTCRPSANTENSRRTREKPLVPRVTRIRIFLKPRTFSQESTFRPHETSESAHRKRSPKRFKAASPRESG